MRVAALLVSAALVAGCGGERDRGPAEPASLSRDDYQAAMFAAAGKARAATRLWGQMVIRERPPAACAALARHFHSAVKSGVEAAARLNPPSEIADSHRRFVAAARASVGEVARVVDRVGSGEVRCGRELNDALYGMPSTQQAEEALAEIERAGIPLGRQ